MMSDDEHATYWVVKFNVFAFETKEQAEEMMDALMDAYCAIPQAEGYGASASVQEESDE